VLGIHDQRLNTDLFQRRIRAFPVDTRTLPDDRVGCKPGNPFGHSTPIPLESTELPPMDYRFTIGLGDNDTDRDRGQMNIPPHGAAKNRLNVHDNLPEKKVEGKNQRGALPGSRGGT